MNSAQKNYARMLPNPISAQASNACVEIFSVRAAVLIWLVVLKSTRALKRIEVNRLIDFSLAFSEPTQRADSDEKYATTIFFHVAYPEPARWDRLHTPHGRGASMYRKARHLDAKHLRALTSPVIHKSNRR